MNWSRLLVLCAVVAYAKSLDLHFPPGFKFGVGTAAYQVEGAWNVSDKGESVWDNFFHNNSEYLAKYANGDVACDSYHRYKEDVKIIAALGAHFYKFSIAWSRVLPNGFTSHISKDGMKYYNNLIDELLKHGIEPVIVMYHWDLPQPLQDLGGWQNPEIVEWFAEYARVLYTHYGDRVKTWITINEPIMLCDYVMQALNIESPQPSEWYYTNNVCTKYVILAHAKAWRIYDDDFRPKYKGHVSISNHVIWIEGKASKDRELAELIMEYMNGRFTHPIFSKHGGWPPKLEATFAEHSRVAGRNASSLPPFTEEEKTYVKGTYDFFALNYYTARVASPAEKGERLVPLPLGDVPEFGAKISARPEWKYSASKYIPIYPKGFRKTLNWIQNMYGSVKIVITENGYSSFGRDIKDDDRIQNMREHLEQVLLAIHEDGIEVTGYTYWSLIDDFEWLDGYSLKFGLYDVDFSSPELTRTPRRSARYYANIIQQRALVAAPHNSASDNYLSVQFSLCWTLNFLIVLYHFIL